jgi:hypothetical protein
MRLPRMTTRRWMLAVAILGSLLGAVVGGRRLEHRRDYCLQQASDAARLEATFRTMERLSASQFPPQRPSNIITGRTYEAAEVAEYFAGRKERFLRAAYRPWLAVPPPLESGVILIRDRDSGVIFEYARSPLTNSDTSPTS